MRPPAAHAERDVHAQPGPASAPDTGASLGVSLDWVHDSIAQYSERLAGRRWR